MTNAKCSLLMDQSTTAKLICWDHIARASARVIEYETDWNINVEQHDGGSTSQQHLNINDEATTPRDPDGSMGVGTCAPSMTSAPGQALMHGQGTKGLGEQYKKHAQTTFLESMDAKGRMPGGKEGGIFGREQVGRAGDRTQNQRCTSFSFSYPFQ